MSLNWIVTMYNSVSGAYAYHTLFCSEENLAAVCENLAGMLTDLTKETWYFEDATALSNNYPL